MIRLWLFVMIFLATGIGSLTADDPKVFQPQPVTIKQQPLANGWVELKIVDQVAQFRQDILITSSFLDESGQLWVGTSDGRLLKNNQGEWTTEVLLPRSQITGVAATAEQVWLSSSDGMFRLRHPKETEAPAGVWQIDRFRSYHKGHPAFVSGGYIAGTDSERLWGHVEGVFIPPKDDTYAPFAISEEHGLYSWTRYGLWHQFLPHYWGANSPWLDTQKLIPHRRPTGLAEDSAGNLWIATEGDGLIRMNAPARKYHERDSTDNAKDGTEWTRFQSAELGCDAFRINDVTPSLSGVWVAISGSNRGESNAGQWVGRFANEKWQLFPMPVISRHAYRGKTIVQTNSWQSIPMSICEITPERVLVGVKDSHAQIGLYELNPGTGDFSKIREIKTDVREVVSTSDGSVWVRSWYGLFFHPPGPIVRGETPHPASSPANPMETKP